MFTLDRGFRFIIIVDLFEFEVFYVFLPVLHLATIAMQVLLTQKKRMMWKVQCGEGRQWGI